MLRSFHMLFLSLMGRLPTYFPEDRRMVKDPLVSSGAVVKALTVHLPHGSHVVVGVLEADEAVTFGLPCPFVSHHLGTKRMLSALPPPLFSEVFCSRCEEQARGTLALRKDGYLLKALARMSSLTSLPRSPQKIRKSSGTKEQL